jgi:hypothetical protein
MYSVEKTQYLLWTTNKRIQNSPVMFRTRSPSPEPSASGRITSRRELDCNTFISYSSLKQLDDFDIMATKAREVSLEYISSKLNISHNIPFYINNIYIINDCKIVFKVTVYELNIEEIKNQLQSSLKIYNKIWINGLVCDKYVSNPNTAIIRVNCSISNICIFSLLDREKFSFTTTLNNLDESPKYCFDAFRNLCRTDKLLNELFEKCMIQYVDIDRESVNPIIRGFINYNEERAKKSNN